MERRRSGRRNGEAWGVSTVNGKRRWRSRPRLRLAALLWVAGLACLLGACGGAAGDGTQSGAPLSKPPAAGGPDPGDLVQLAFPSTVGEIEALLAQIAEALSDDPSAQLVRGVDEYALSWRNGELSLSVRDVSTGSFFPVGSTAGDIVLLFASGADWEVLAAGQDGVLAWVEWKTVGTELSGDPYDTYALTWGEQQSPWLFMAAGRDRAGMAVAVGALISVLRAE